MTDGTTDGFGPDHLPYGIFSVDGGPRRVGVRLGDGVLDLAALSDRPELAEPTLNPLMALGPQVWRETREHLAYLVESGSPTVPLADVVLHLPFEVADYVDFYASEHHATNVGKIFRPDGAALPAAWKHLPIGYHGRAGTVVASGTHVVRPSGHRGPGDVGPSLRLDLEAELGFVVGTPSPQGQPVGADDLADHVFGVVGLNDWSARDLQAFESAPLGPFLGKSFATSISHWVTPLAALDAAWCDLPGQDPRPADHLAPDTARGLDLDVEVEVAGAVLSRPSYSSMYWGPAQMLAHLTSNGASLRTGDLVGSGTISGTERDQRGCLLELTWGGTEPIDVDGRERTWLEDGDEVVLRYSAPSVSGARLTLGEVRGSVLPARGSR